MGQLRMKSSNMFVVKIYLNLAKMLLENTFKDAQQITESNQEIISKYRYYLTPTMYMAILKNSKESGTIFAKMS